MLGDSIYDIYIRELILKPIHCNAAQGRRAARGGAEPHPRHQHCVDAGPPDPHQRQPVQLFGPLADGHPHPPCAVSLRRVAALFSHGTSFRCGVDIESFGKVDFTVFERFEQSLEDPRPRHTTPSSSFTAWLPSNLLTRCRQGGSWRQYALLEGNYTGTVRRTSLELCRRCVQCRREGPRNSPPVPLVMSGLEACAGGIAHRAPAQAGGRRRLTDPGAHGVAGC